MDELLDSILAGLNRLHTRKVLTNEEKRLIKETGQKLIELNNTAAAWRRKALHSTAVQQ